MNWRDDMDIQGEVRIRERGSNELDVSAFNEARVAGSSARLRIDALNDEHDLEEQLKEVWE